VAVRGHSGAATACRVHSSQLSSSLGGAPGCEPGRRSGVANHRRDREAIPDRGQIQGLADAAGGHGALVLQLGFTGLRFGVAAALSVRDIDLIRGRVRVHRSVTAVGGEWCIRRRSRIRRALLRFPGSWSMCCVSTSPAATPARWPSPIRTVGRCACTMCGVGGGIARWPFRCAGRAVPA
jgi:hypothetical protein